MSTSRRTAPHHRQRCGVGGAPVAELTHHRPLLAARCATSTSRSCATSDENYLANIRMEGQQSEHEEESGHLQLHEHPFNKDLALSDVADVPFRELWMRDGMQTFEPLVTLETAS